MMRTLVRPVRGYHGKDPTCASPIAGDRDFSHRSGATVRVMTAMISAISAAALIGVVAVAALALAYVIVIVVPYAWRMPGIFDRMPS